jgi:uncharacterized membrane protein (DUF106 family)
LPEERPAAPMGGSQMLMMMMLFVTMFIIFQPDMRNAIGGIAGIVLYPIIGFGGHYPVLTVMIAGLLMVTLSTVIRHYFIDWVDTAQKQAKMKDFNKKMREARLSGNQSEIQRLSKKQMEMTRDTMSSTIDQMKPMMFTMIFVVATFAFIGTFIQDVDNATLSVPWASNVDMGGQISTSTCCMFQVWMLVYMLVSISMAQVIQRVLKWYSFDKKLKEIEYQEARGEDEDLGDDE